MSIKAQQNQQIFHFVWKLTHGLWQIECGFLTSLKKLSSIVLFKNSFSLCFVSMKSNCWISSHLEFGFFSNSPLYMSFMHNLLTWKAHLFKDMLFLAKSILSINPSSPRAMPWTVPSNVFFCQNKMNEWGGSVAELDSFVMYFWQSVPKRYATHLVLRRKISPIFDSVTFF